MSASDYLIGLPFALATYGSVAVAAEIAVRRLLPHLRGAPRVVAWVMLATAALLLACLVPAALTVLSRETMTLAALLIAALVAVFAPAREAGPGESVSPQPPVSSRAERLLAIVGIGGACLWLGYTAIRYRTHEPMGFDAAGAYFPTAARWLQEGSIWEIADWIPNAFYGSGPGNGSVIVLSAMLPWENDFVAHLAMYPFVVLFAVAIYALATELGAPRAIAALLGSMLAATPVVVQPGLVDGLLDPLMYSTLAAGMLFLVRHNRTAARADLLLAGLALGICFGTKFYGYTSVAALIAIWAAARLIGGTKVATVARQTLTVGGVVIAAGGIWMLRNWIATGNPLMPLRIEIFGWTIFDAPPDPQRGIFGYALLDYAGEPSVWFDTLAHQFRVAVGVVPVLLAAALAAAAGLLVRRRRRGLRERLDGVAAAAIAASLVLGLVYAATPYTAAGPEGEPLAAAVNVRYGIPAAIAAVAAAAWLSGRISRPWRAALALAAVVATLDALRVGPVNGASVAYACFAIALLAAVAFALVESRLASLRLPRRPGRTQLIAGAAVALVLLAVGGRVFQRAYNEDRYLGGDRALDYVIDNSGDGRTVGLAGFWTLAGVVPPYPAFGTSLENRVEFVGSTVDDALLRRIDRRRAFLGKLRRLDPDLLIVGRDVPSEFDPDRDRESRPGAELAWAQSAGYRPVARSERFIVLQLSPA